MARSSEHETGSTALIAAAARGQAPEIERMPRPTLRTRVEMRDGAKLDTWVWLPFEHAGPVPAILFRTPYQEHVLGWARLRTLAYRDAGYAVVFQLVRGIGGSDGEFRLFDPLDRPDGYDAVEWVAAQPWCDGAVGMDGSSYGALTQLAAASLQPPHLRCIVPAVPSIDLFNDVGRFGGVLTRQHLLGWMDLVQAESLAELTPGLWGDAALLGAPAAWRRLLLRPAIDAAEGLLSEGPLRLYREMLSHAVEGAWTQARMLQPEDYARIEVPALLVTGLFDATNGTQHVWRMLEAHAPSHAERYLLIGPWDHGQAYVGGGKRHGPWKFDPAHAFDLPAARLAFFDRRLRGRGEGPPLRGRVTSFLNGAQRWIGADAYPDARAQPTPLYLHSDGLANLRGRGRLDAAPPGGDELPDRFLAEPDLPFVPVAASLDPELALDLRERERLEDVLVYASAPLERPLTLHGQPDCVLHVAVDAPDGDVVVWLAEASPDGSRTTKLSRGQLRLRYRRGFDREVQLTPGEPVEVVLRMEHVSHQLSAGHRLKLLIGCGMFPTFDPNPNTGEPIATAVETRTAVQTVFHDAARPSHVRLPVLPQELG